MGCSLENFRITISKLLWIKSNAAQISIAYDKKRIVFILKNTHCNELEISFRKDRDSSLFKNVKSQKFPEIGYYKVRTQKKKRKKKGGGEVQCIQVNKDCTTPTALGRYLSH